MFVNPFPARTDPDAARLGVAVFSWQVGGGVVGIMGDGEKRRIGQVEEVWEMDEERLKEQLRRDALGIVEKVAAKMPSCLRRFRDVEKALKEATEQLGREWLQSWCDEAEDDSATPLCPQCGGRMRRGTGSVGRHGRSLSVRQALPPRAGLGAQASQRG
jgi:hypothetical protein